MSASTLTQQELLDALPVIRRLRAACDAANDVEGFNALVIAHRAMLDAAAELEREGQHESRD